MKRVRNKVVVGMKYLIKIKIRVKQKINLIPLKSVNNRIIVNFQEVNYKHIFKKGWIQILRLLLLQIIRGMTKIKQNHKKNTV